MYKILDGKSLRNQILLQIKNRLLSEIAKSNDRKKPPRLDLIIVGDDYGSKKYIQAKKKFAQEIGFKSVIHQFNNDVEESELLAKIDELNAYPEVTGFFIQLPLPKLTAERVDINKLVDRISPEKDIDGLTAINLGKLFHLPQNINVDPLNEQSGVKSSLQNEIEYVEGGKPIMAATPRGIMMLLDHYKIDVEGKDVVLVGWSKIVGMPLSAELLRRGATLTICHDKTVDLKEKTLKGDILISATGVPHLIKGDMIKNGAILIDVGISLGPDGKLVGDIDITDHTLCEKAEWITPVPGGVGPMTIAALMQNTFDVWLRS